MSPNNHHINLSNTHWITSQSVNEKQYLSTCKNIFIGIDFGTSTTVVSQVTVNNYKVYVNPVALSQPDEYGAMIRHHLINSARSPCGTREMTEARTQASVLSKVFLEIIER